MCLHVCVCVCLCVCALYYQLAQTQHLYSNIIHVQVPSHNHSRTPDDALKHFQQEVPALGLLGTPHYIHPDTPYTVDEEVQLVCKYLKALKVGGKKGIDKLYKEGEVQVLPLTTKKFFFPPPSSLVPRPPFPLGWLKGGLGRRLPIILSRPK